MQGTRCRTMQLNRYNWGTAKRRDRRQTSTTSSSTTPNMISNIQQLSRDPDSLSAWASTLSKLQKQQLKEMLPKQSAPFIEPVVPEPSLRELKLVALNTCIPFIGFGFLDNAILIIAGDAIDTSLGVVLGISTMCAAAIGNIVSDVAGLMLGTAIEDYCATRLNLPTADLTNAQRRLRSVRFASQMGCGVGVVIGCIIGMFPLLFLDSNKVQAKKRQAHLDSLFRDVVTEAGSLVGASKTSLYLRVNKSPKGTAVVPVHNGDFLYNKYGAHNAEEKWISLGRGLVSRAALTREAWNIKSVRDEPDCSPDEESSTTMLCVPIMDSTGQCIAVLQASDKKGGETFVETDVQILKALASHISVALLRLYDGEEEETQLKDTIKLLRDYGLSGLHDDGSQNNEQRGKWKPLFPDNA